ncbi:transposase, partial [Clostridium tetani]
MCQLLVVLHFQQLNNILKIKKHHKGNDTVQLTIKIKLIPIKEQKLHIQDTCLEYIKTVNDTVSLMVAENKSLKLTSKD